MKPILLLLTIFITSHLHSQSPDLPFEGSIPDSALSFSIHGRTRQEALRQFLRWDTTRVFRSVEELENTAEEYRRKIANTRLFDTVEVAVSPDDQGTMKVQFSLKEPAGISFLQANTLLLPVVTFDTNTGLIAGAGYQDQNFLGNLTEFRLNGEFRDMTDGKKGGWLFGSWTIPVENSIEPSSLFLGFNLGLDISGQSSSYGEGKYRWALTQGLYSQVSLKGALNPSTGRFTGYLGSGLETSHRWENWTSGFSVNQYLQAPEDGADTYFTQWSIGTSQAWDFRRYFGFFGSSKAQWGGLVQYFFWPYVPMKEESRKGIILLSQPAFTLEGVSWQGVFRQGGSLKLSHNLSVRADDAALLENIGKLDFQAHFAGTWAAASFRFLGEMVFSGLNKEGGKEVRGILNQNLTTYSRAVLNADFPGKIPLGPVNQTLELLLVPFMDAAAVVAAPESLKPSGFYAGVGMELILIPAFAKTSLIRLSGGWNASGFPSLSGMPEEISLDLAHFY